MDIAITKDGDSGCEEEEVGQILLKIKQYAKLMVY